MAEARIPDNEKQRLEALERLQLLDTPIEERFEKIVRLACSSMQMPIASFVLIDDKRQWIKANQGLGAYETTRDIAMCAHTILEDDILEIQDATKDPRFSDNPFVTKDPHITFYAGCPVRDPSGYKIGTLCVVDTKPRSINNDEKQNLRDLASMIETELRASHLMKTQGRLVSELDNANRRALTDPLTRLWNRDGMSELIKREWALMQRRQKEIVAIMVDIDHFKKINDRYGHAAGDDVLRSVSKTLLAELRAEDILGRIGGEEFLIILSGCDKASAMDTAERLRMAVEKTPAKLPFGEIKATISLGVAVAVPNKTDTAGWLIKSADEALYHAKTAGRNRIEAVDPTLGRRSVVGGDPFTYDITLNL